MISIDFKTAKKILLVLVVFFSLSVEAQVLTHNVSLSNQSIKRPIVSRLDATVSKMDYPLPGKLFLNDLSRLEDIPLPIGATESSIKVFSNNIQLKQGVDYKVDTKNRRIILINATRSKPEDKVQVDYKKPPLILARLTKGKCDIGTIDNPF